MDATTPTGKGRSALRSARRRRSVRPAKPGKAPPHSLAARQAVGNFLRATRSARKLTQEQVAAMTRSSPWKLSRAAISAIERGQNFPGMEAMLALSHVLYVDPKEIVERARLSTVVPVDITGMSFDQLEHQASAYFWSGEFRKSLAVYDAILEKIALEGPPGPSSFNERVALLDVRRATALKRAGALISAIATAERAIALSAEAPEIQAQAYVVLADLQVQRGHLPLARDAAQRAVELSRGAQPNVQGWSWMVNARVLYLSQRFEEARRSWEQARERVHAAGDRRHLTHVEGDIGLCWLALGRTDEAAACLERAVALAREHEQPALEASWLIELGKLALAAGLAAEADSRAAAALALAEPRDQYLTIFRAEWLRHRARHGQSAAASAARLERLRKLYLLLDQHEGIEEVAEFRSTAARVVGAEGKER